MIDILKSIIGISGNDFDIVLVYISVAFVFYFMILFFNFISSLFNGASR